MDKKTYEYMESRVGMYRQLESEIKEAKKLIERLVKVKEDNSLVIYFDGNPFVLTPRMVKEVKRTLKNEYDLIILENEKEMEEI